MRGGEILPFWALVMGSCLLASVKVAALLAVSARVDLTCREAVFHVLSLARKPGGAYLWNKICNATMPLKVQLG